MKFEWFLNLEGKNFFSLFYFRRKSEFLLHGVSLKVRIFFPFNLCVIHCYMLH